MGSPRRFALLCTIAALAWGACIWGMVHMSRPSRVAAATVAAAPAPSQPAPPAPSLEVVPVPQQRYHAPDLQIAEVAAKPPERPRHHRRKPPVQTIVQVPESPDVVSSDEPTTTIEEPTNPEAAPKPERPRHRRTHDSLTKAFERENAVIDDSGDRGTREDPRRSNAFRRRREEQDRHEGDQTSRHRWMSRRNDTERDRRFTIWD